MEIRDGEIYIEKPPNALDELVLDIVSIFDRLDVQYVVVSGYVAVLLGRSRATEDIDVIVERFDEGVAAKLVRELQAAGYWGAAMPLEELHSKLEDGLPIRIAEDGHRVPNVELKYPTDRYSRLSLENTVIVTLDRATLRVGSLELQIAYKLRMGAQKDHEDALYLYHLSKERLPATGSNRMSKTSASNPNMKDSRTVEDVLEANQRERRSFIKEWAEYVRTHPDEEWGAQVNTLVDAQLASARQFEDERPDLDEIDSRLLDE